MRIKKVTDIKKIEKRKRIAKKFDFPVLHCYTHLETCPKPIEIEKAIAQVDVTARVLKGKFDIVKKHLTAVREAHLLPLKWLSQFDNQKDQYTAIKILKNFEYISLRQAREYFRTLHQTLLRQKGFDINKAVFSYLGDAKSGGMMAYIYGQAAKFREKGDAYIGKDLNKKIFSLAHLNEPGFFDSKKMKNVDTLVIIDDMIDSGLNLREFMSPPIKKLVDRFQKGYYITLLKNEKGVKNVQDLVPKFQFLAAKNISQYDSKECKTFTDKEKEEIKNFIAKYSQRIAPEHVQKYINSKIFVAFEWNTPGNTPIPFCFDAPGKWQSLFKRYNGLT